MLEVRDSHLGLAVFATKEIAPGERILRESGIKVPHRTRHTIQSGYDCHVDYSGPIRNINHSCDPNCGLIIRKNDTSLELYALRPIAAGEELRTDYCTFENEIHFMTGPCLCGSDICRGRITGFKDLSPERITHYGEYIAEFLQPVTAISQAG
ncbi:MAG: SET domain-containing protein [Isosphaeraceae bacterium]